MVCPGPRSSFQSNRRQARVVREANRETLLRRSSVKSRDSSFFQLLCADSVLPRRRRTKNTQRLPPTSKLFLSRLRVESFAATRHRHQKLRRLEPSRESVVQILQLP